MPGRLKKEIAEAYLSDVPQDKVFFVEGNGTLKSLKGLSKALRTMSTEIFKHHVNPERNDFKNWILHVICDVKLAKDISKVKTANTMQKKIKERIVQLTKAAKR